MHPELLKMKDTSQFKISLLADENIPTRLIELLSKDGFDIKRAKTGSKDEHIFNLAKSDNRILLTLNKHFLKKAKFPPQESSGIIFIQIHPPLIDSLHFSLKKLFNSIEPSEFKGRLFILSSTMLKIFPKK